MTVGYLWGIVATIGFFAFTLILEIVKLSRSLKSSDDELTSARQKITSLDDKQNEAIADLIKLHLRETDELKKEITKLSHIDLPPETTKTITTEQIKILELLFKKDSLSSEKVAENLNIEIQAAEYHLEELQASNMITKHTFRPEVVTPSFVREKHYRDYTVSVWKMEQGGRKYLNQEVSV